MSKGFTLIEIIIVICLFILLAVIVWPVGANFYRQSLVNKAEQQLIWVLKQARSEAINQKNNASFGVYLAGTKAVLFQGDNYNQRIINQDVIFSLPNIVSISGMQEVTFAANTGFVADPGSITVSSSLYNKVITINKLGIIDY